MYFHFASQNYPETAAIRQLIWTNGPKPGIQFRLINRILSLLYIGKGMIFWPTIFIEDRGKREISEILSIQVSSSFSCWKFYGVLKHEKGANIP